MGLLDNAKDKILQETVQELTRLKSEIQNMTAQSIKNAKAQINTEVISKIKNLEQRTAAMINNLKVVLQQAKTSEDRIKGAIANVNNNIPDPNSLLDKIQDDINKIIENIKIKNVELLSETQNTIKNGIGKIDCYVENTMSVLDKRLNEHLNDLDEIVTTFKGKLETEAKALIEDKLDDLIIDFIRRKGWRFFLELFLSLIGLAKGENNG